MFQFEGHWAGRANIADGVQRQSAGQFSLVQGKVGFAIVVVAGLG